MAFIEIENLVHRYEGRDESEPPALKGVNISVEEGEFLAIVGTNGSGKSTLAKHLNAILLPTAGRVTVDGRNTADPAELWEIRKTVGMVFQNPDNHAIWIKTDNLRRKRMIPSCIFWHGCSRSTIWEMMISCGIMTVAEKNVPSIM